MNIVAEYNFNHGKEFVLKHYKEEFDEIIQVINSVMVYNVCAKMTIFKNLGIIDVGIEIVPVKIFADDMSTGVSYFEQFARSIEYRYSCISSWYRCLIYIQKGALYNRIVCTLA
ncbi:MAG: hypothetical protein LBJ41_05115 [Treponema sp.]|jgi:hypothetical protein|nr:hypothetical protein [Treponema sp.]